MGAATALSKDSFATTTGQGVTLVDFWAEWCGPCKAIAPIIEELAHEYQGRAVVAKVDVDKEPDLAMEFGVQSIPTLLIFKNGDEVKRFVGVTPKAELAKAIDGQL